MAETLATAATATVEQPAPKTLILVSSDGERFEIAESVAMQSLTIKNVVEDGCGGDPIPLPNVTGRVLAKVIEYLKNHDGEQNKENDNDLLSVPLKELFEYILAANYLNIQDLNDLVAQKIADSIKDKSPEWVRNLFGIENDYSPKEEAEVRKQFEWAFDDINDD